MRINTNRMNALPSVLLPKSIIKFPSGMTCSIITTKHKNNLNEKLYRLWFHAGVRDGWYMAGLAGSSFYTRDQLADQDAELIIGDE